MVLVEQYNESQIARDSQIFLKSHGIIAKLAVDPLSSRAPALGDFDGLGLFVEPHQVDAAVSLLREVNHSRKEVCKNYLDKFTKYVLAA